MQLILLGRGGHNIDARLHHDSSNNLLTNEISAHHQSLLSPSRTSNPARFKAKLHHNPALKIHIPDLNLVQSSLGVLVNVDVDGEMCVHISHLVLETLGDTDNQVVDECADCAEGSDVLAGAVVQLDVDDILLGVREVDCEMVQVLGELAYFLLVRSLFPTRGDWNWSVPRGPSTVTRRDLMVTLTVKRT